MVLRQLSVPLRGSELHVFAWLRLLLLLEHRLFFRGSLSVNGTFNCHINGSGLLIGVGSSVCQLQEAQCSPAVSFGITHNLHTRKLLN